MSNRAQRRAQVHKHGKQFLLDRMSKNGITPDDLEKAESRAFHEGFMKAAIPIYKICYAAACITLHENYGFGRKRCRDFLNKLDTQVIDNLTSIEACEKVFDTLGLQLDFNSLQRAALKEEKE